ncbi:holin [Streptomyces sp. IBSBF 2435]|uniref:holin n=1 Tax=Streptomyces sp. IBSBF 2435 TaxID=2903531 RepID=UPI002FDC0CAF
MASTTAKRWLIEAKVAASTGAAAAFGIGAAVLNDVAADHTLLGGTPAWAQALVLVVAPPLATFLAGYSAKHTPRPDLDTTSVR